MSEKTVKVVLLKSCQLGSIGDTVDVIESIAKVMTTPREIFDGRVMTQYRTARLASEEVKEIPLEAKTQAEMGSKKNVVETPKDEILPKRFKGVVKPAEEPSEKRK